MADNIVRTGAASRTALGVAMLRAAHQLLDDPIVLADPIALPILGPRAEAAMREDPFQHNDPISRGLRAALVVRSRFAEDELARAVSAGVGQDVALGAGLDTFACRNPFSQLDVFEVDHPSTQSWKRQMLEEAGIPLPARLRFAPVDFEQSSLAEGLAEAGFDAARPACFSWLGVTMYLSEDAILDTLGFIAGRPKGSSVTLDFRAPASMLNPVQRAIADVISQRAAALGEPWISSFEPAALRDKVARLGFSEVSTYEPEDLNCRYLSRRKDGLRSGGRLLCARI